MVTKLDAKEIQETVRRKYAEVSRSAADKFNYPTGKEGALNLKYDLSEIEAVPDDVLSSFCGVGNPFSLGPIKRGETVLDVGCGAGFDFIIAGRMTGRTGRACGIDLTPEMVTKTQKATMVSELSNCEVRLAGSESIPYKDRTFDIVISNGVLNMSPDKEKSFQEIYRVLKPGGRLQFADIVLKKDLPEKIAGSLQAWTD
jgi:SAM-dependent methyltransferase